MAIKAKQRRRTTTRADGSRLPANGFGRIGATALLLAPSLAPSMASAAEWDFQPRVELGQNWTDNIALAPGDLEESDWVTELRPGLAISVEGPRVVGELDYEMQVLRFDDNSDRDDVFNRLTGTGSLAIIPESAYIDAFARYGQLNVDSRGRQAFSNLFTTDNRTDYGAAGISPYHEGTWGTWGESLVKLTAYDIRYRNTDPGIPPPEDSDGLNLVASLNSPSEARGLRWRVRGSYTDTNFERAEDFKYAQALFDIGVPVGYRTRLTGTVGGESDVVTDQTQGGLDESVWLVGFVWEPSDLQTVQVRGGERFYGTAWEANWQRRGSKGELSLDYTETPTTSSGVVGDDSLFMPGFPTIDIGTLTTRAFLQKRMSGVASYTLTRSIVAARVYSDKRQYLDLAGGNEDGAGFTVSFDWDAATRTRVGAILTFEKRKFEGGRKDDFGELNLLVSRQINRVLSAELGYRYFLRDSNIDPDYKSNLISLFFIARFGLSDEELAESRPLIGRAER